MSNSNTTLHLIRKTGICPNNYMYWPSKEACDSWFIGKSMMTLEDYAYVRGDTVSRHGYNTGCVHVDVPYNETTNCDYLSYKNTDIDDRWFHCQVVSREYVNEKSCRIHFVIDYVASFYDSISIEKCFVERTHVTGDWQTEGTRSASKYLLAEPVGVEIRHRPECLKHDPFLIINNLLLPNVSEFNLIATIDKDGKFNEPEINYQSGVPLGGYLYTGLEVEMRDLLSKYVTYSNQAIVKQQSILSYVSDIYIAPAIVTENKTKIPTEYYIEETFDSLINNPVKVRHAKVLDYFRLRVVGNTTDVIMSPAEYGSDFAIEVLPTGGPSGCVTLLFNDKERQLNGISTSTMPWPAVPFTAIIPREKYALNDKIKQTVKEAEAKRAEISGRTDSEVSSDAEKGLQSVGW